MSSRLLDEALNYACNEDLAAAAAADGGSSGDVTADCTEHIYYWIVDER
jgi:hypothetical protein